jgi:carbon starvation protein
VTAVPLFWDVAVTLTASWQKVFSADPKVGFFAQRDKFQTALDADKVLPPAKSLGDMQQVVTNSTVDGFLAAFFAILIVVVILDAARVWFATTSGRREPVLAETPPEPSKLWAPSGLIPTAEERAYLAEAKQDGSEPALSGPGGQRVVKEE